MMMKRRKGTATKTNYGQAGTYGKRMRAAAFLMAFLFAMNALAACGSTDAAPETETAGSIVESTGTESGTSITKGMEAGTEELTELVEGTETVETESAETETATEEAVTEESETETESEAETESENTGGAYTYSSVSKTMYAKQSVNVRDLPSTDGNKLGSLSKGESVAVTGQCNETGWYRIIYNGKTGYCSGNYLTGTKPSSDSSSGSSGGSSSSSGNSGSSGSSSGSSGASGSPGSSGSDEEEYYEEELVVTDKLLAEYAQKIVELVNKERKAAGVPTVKANSLLMGWAQVRAEEQVESFGHTRPDGSDCMTIIPEEYGCIFGSCGTENAGMGTGLDPEGVMDLWMNSAGHRGNILDEDYDEIGVGVYYYHEDFYYIQLFTNHLHKHTWSAESIEIMFGEYNCETYECYECTYEGCVASKRVSDGKIM